MADWAENALIAPQYARQSQYWAAVLWEPEIPEFAEWPMEGARGLLVQVLRRATAYDFKFATVSDAQVVVAVL